MATIPEKALDLFQKKALAYLATVLPDGTPHVTPVWCDYDGTHIRINSAVGRQKDRNIRRNRRVGLTIVDPDDTGRHLDVRGVVAEIVTEGAEAHIDALSRKYEEHDWTLVPNQQRVIYKIKPLKVSGG
jgi:PPOX class probable F420-dependent enzyme